MVFIILVVLGSVFLVDRVDQDWPILAGPSGLFSVFFGFLALILIVTRIARLRANAELDQGVLAIKRMQSLYAKAQKATLSLAAGAHFTLMFATHLPIYVSRPFGSQFFGLDELLMILPFMVLLVTGYVRLYPVDRMVREAMIGELLNMAEPVQPVWSRRQYVSFQLRFQVLLVAVPLMIIVAFKDILDSYRPVLAKIGEPILAHFGLSRMAEFTSDGLLGLAAMGVVFFSPWLIRLLWRCRPLPAGSLRDHLRGLAAKIHLNYRDILLWPTYGVVINAAVMGLVGRLRYIVLSDGLIESMTDGQIEAVFGHETGHVKHHHLPLLLMFAFASMGLILLIACHIDMVLDLPPYVMEGGMFVAVIIVWFLVFGRISRAFEREADLFAVESLSKQLDNDTSACMQDECLRHHPKVSDAIVAAEPLCKEAGQTVCSALYRAASLNAIPRSAKTWRHGSIDQRCGRIMKLVANPSLLASARMTMAWLRVIIVVVTFAVVLWAMLSLDQLQTYFTTQ